MAEAASSRLPRMGTVSGQENLSSASSTNSLPGQVRLVGSTCPWPGWAETQGSTDLELRDPALTVALLGFLLARETGCDFDFLKGHCRDKNHRFYIYHPPLSTGREEGWWPRVSGSILISDSHTEPGTAWDQGSGPTSQDSVSSVCPPMVWGTVEQQASVGQSKGRDWAQSRLGRFLEQGQREVPTVPTSPAGRSHPFPGSGTPRRCRSPPKAPAAGPSFRAP